MNLKIKEVLRNFICEMRNTELVMLSQSDRKLILAAIDNEVNLYIY